MCRLLQITVLLTIPFVSAGEALAGELVLVGKPIAQAKSLIGLGEIGFQLQFKNGQLDVPQSELVRWSHPRVNTKSGEIVLTDGSRCVLAEAWGKDSSLQVAGDDATVVAKEFGRLKLPLKHIKAAMLRGPVDFGQRSQLWNKILGDTPGREAIYLANGDVLEGDVLSINSSDQDEPTIDIRASDDDQPYVVDTNLVAAVCWSERQAPEAPASLAVGLSDGSYLYVRKLRQREGQLVLELACGTEVSVAARQVVYLQNLEDHLRYLSDTQPHEYRHQPYLRLTRPLQSDRNVLGLPLRSAGLRYAKGLGMPTAAEAVYAIPSGYRRFSAQIALDDEARPTGSVEFRVALRKESRWVEVFASETITSDDPPQLLSIDLQDASEIRLETHYADRGDQQDYANWLDARFE